MTVELINHMGNDLTIVNAARVSYHKESRILSSADQLLIGYLARERHGSPFEHVYFSFRVRVPIFVAREWFRHRIGSFSEESGRYVELRPDFYHPPYVNIRTQVGKPGAYEYQPLEGAPAEEAADIISGLYEESYEAYELLLKLGVARELARTVLPVGLLTEFIWTVNFRSLTNFLSLRTAPNALLEIRAEAALVEAHVANTVPVAYNAWVAGGRQSL